MSSKNSTSNPMSGYPDKVTVAMEDGTTVTVEVTTEMLQKATKLAVKVFKDDWDGYAAAERKKSAISGFLEAVAETTVQKLRRRQHRRRWPPVMQQVRFGFGLNAIGSLIL
jgi:hypothetical protein